MGHKLMTAEEAIARFVHDGDSVHMGQITEAFGLTREVARQGKRDLTLVCAGHGNAGLLATVAGCSQRAITAYLWSALLPGRIRELIQSGELQIEDYTNQTLTLMLMAGALGMPFVPTRSLLGTDYIAPGHVPQPGGFLGAGKLKTMCSPFDGRPAVLLPALRPDVCLIHTQWADEEGNAVFLGGPGDGKWAAWAAERVIVSAEEIVPGEVMRSDPQRVSLPGIRVSAVVHMPCGALPTPLSGYYRAYFPFLQDLIEAVASDETLRQFLDHWVYDCPNHDSFLARLKERFGDGILDDLKPDVRTEPLRQVWYGFDSR